ncbi:hypothetical protein JCM10296v2_007691 [Rhodotorula toruloides]
MPSKAEELKAAGNAAFKAGNFDLALANYSTAIQLDPSVSAYALNRAAVHLKLSNWRDAERDSTTALELDGGANPKALYRRGLARKGLGKLSGAKEDFEEARKQGAGDDVAKELAALVRQLDLNGTKANGVNEAKTNGVVKLAAASRPVPSSSPAASSSSSPSTERLRAALASPASSSPSLPPSQPAKSDGLLTPVSTRRLTPAKDSAPPSSVPSEPPASTSSPKTEPLRTNSFAAKKEARQAREQQPYRAQPPLSPPAATAFSAAPAPSSLPSLEATVASATPPTRSTSASSPTSFLRPPAPPAHRASASPTSLETHFFSTVPGDPSRLAILRALDSSRMRDWMGDGLTPDLLSAMLGEILPLFKGDAANDEGRRKRDAELDWIVPLLQGLTECRRWDSAVMFLEEREKEGVKRVLDEAEGRIARVRKGWGL